MSIRVGLLDDHRSFGESLSLAISAFDDITTVGVASTIDELVRLAIDEGPDVLLIDYQLAEGTGIDCAERLEGADPRPRLILLTAHASPDVTKRALSRGFERVISKEAPLDFIIEAVRTMSPTPGQEWTAKEPVRFSRRQREVLELMGQGLDPATIAEHLYISVHTARSHVKDVLRLLQASTQLAAVTKAIREGYLLPPTRNDPAP